jgi:hypothetical protein
MMLKFPLERPVFVREYGTATYGALPYFISKTLVELPMALLTVLVAQLCFYWFMGMQVGSISFCGSQLRPISHLLPFSHSVHREISYYWH